MDDVTPLLKNLQLALVKLLDMDFQGLTNLTMANLAFA